MLLDFNSMQEITCPGMNDGTGTMSSRMYVDAENRMVYCRIHPGSSIGMHTHNGSADINYVISGHGRAICDGEEEMLVPGTCHYCRNGQAHSIINDGNEDLIIFTVVPKAAEV